MRYLFWGICCLAWTLAAADLKYCVPDGSHAAFLVRPGILTADQSPLALILHTGEFEKPLTLMKRVGLIRDGEMPDEFMVVFFSATERLTVVSSSLTPAQAMANLAPFVKSGQMAVSETTVAGMPALKTTFFHRRRGDSDEFYALFPGNGTVLCGGDRDPLPVQRITGRFSATMGRLTAQCQSTDALFAASDEISFAGLDIMGMTEVCKSFRFSVSVADGAVQSRLYMEPGKKEMLPQLEQRIRLFQNLLFSALCVGNRNLWNTLNGSVTFRSSDPGAEPALQADCRISAATVKEIDRSWTDQEKQLKSLLQTN